MTSVVLRTPNALTPRGRRLAMETGGGGRTTGKSASERKQLVDRFPYEMVENESTGESWMNRDVVVEGKWNRNSSKKERTEYFI